MKCITSPALDDTQLISYVEGEADDAIVSHIKKCPFCAERANQMTLFQNRLRAQLYRSNCPSTMELGDYHLGFLPPSQELVIGQHIRECPHCRREVADLEEFLALREAEPDFVETVKVLFAQLVGVGSTPALGALRGESKGPLTYEADGMVIVLDVQPAVREQASILGQVAAEEQDQWTGAAVELSQTGAPQMTASLDEFGAFRFDNIRPGATQLTIRSLHGIIVHILNIDIAL
ncbi:MAG TPA: hypothetical protein VJM08_13990 [Anaerolineales bacterium]|nr:hypothetical protein [Anaerolineales bacterium]